MTETSADRGTVARIISHPAVVAILSAALALGATWWLDQRQATRDHDANLRAMTGTLMTDVARTRTNLHMANTARENAERLQAIVRSRGDWRDLNGTYSVTALRVLRALRIAGAPEGDAMALDLVPQVVMPGMLVLRRCALLGRDRLAAPDPDCLGVDVLARSLETCEHAILIGLDATITRPDKSATHYDSARQTCLAQPGLPVALGAS